MAAGCIALIGRQGRIGSHDFQRRKGYIELLGRDLLECRLEALAQLGLAGERRDRAVRIDSYPGIQIGRALEARRQGWRREAWRCRGGLLLGEGAAQRKADDQRATTGEYASAIEDDRGVHRALPWLAGDSSAVSIRCAARRTARRIRICVPQRQRWGASSARISASVGLELRCSSACARIIMPAMQ